MAYIPPHKRQSKDGGGNGLVPTPNSFPVPIFHKRSSTVSESRTGVYNARKVGMMIYAKGAISKWFIQGGSTSDGDQLPGNSLRMEPFRRSQSFEWKRWGDAFVLTCDPSSSTGSLQTQTTPWVSIAENIRDELLDSFGKVREEIRSGEVGEELKLSFVIRIGKILFHGKYFSGGVTTRTDAESYFGHVGRSFCTDLPDSYMETILATVVPKLGVYSHQAKEYYHVKVFDKCNPNTSISIKCRVISGQLKMHKIELNQKRCLVVDVSCLDKDLDLRLMLSTKRGLTTPLMEDAEMLTSLRQLVDSAILDSNAKGGVRWAMGKKFSADGRYTVIGVWHTNVQTFKTSELKIRLRNADRFDFWASDGEVSNEVTLEVTGINASLMTRMDMVEMEVTIAILKETLKLVWDHFLSCDL
ncbi:hypothetical protein C5167_044955 [Papaver somniferum]|uniref:DUF7903 domain-containing protein n=1 Tax=Papaver somniferum TaxID=3469 RepID=A0A4Y7LD91_PAPSO|nr:uncharacterized protein LOC113322365 [Papaver somniferum]RZC82169.1 hypothetical protein C5167_044955 [Papaver somniferum]